MSSSHLFSIFRVSVSLMRETCAVTFENTSTKWATQCSFLIIGYGNELRGDDGVGPMVAMTVADWQLPSVKSLGVQQLTPELAAEIVQADYVIFVDACGQSCAPTIQLNPIVIRQESLQSSTAALLSHTCEPATLVSLTQRLYGRHPQAWLLQIPTEQHDLGMHFSKTAQRGVDKALRKIEQFFITYLRPTLTRSESCMNSV